MNLTKIEQIREKIELAHKIEQDNKTLETYINAKLTSLHRTISLPDDSPEKALVEFITRYINHVPDFLDAMFELSTEANIADCMCPFFKIATEYFSHPPELVEEHTGLLALVDEAYLAHRLVEEMNDRVMMHSGLPFMPMDMTISNIIVHDFLGDEFGNQLDLAVHYSTEVIFAEADMQNHPGFVAFLEAHKRNGWQKELTKWPCLAGDESITLNLAHKIHSSTH